MKTTWIEFAMIRPMTLERLVKEAFPAAKLRWKEINDELYEFTVEGIKDLASYENLLAQYV